MVTVPVRKAPVLAATVYATLPFPVPVAPDVTVIHDALLLAVQIQPAAVVTPTVPDAPVAAMLWSVGAIEYVQEGVATAACVTVNTRVAIVSVPVREAPVLVATVYATEPFPLPVDPDVTVIHDALLPAVH